MIDQIGSHRFFVRNSPFGQVYDGRSKSVDDLDDEDLLLVTMVHRIRPGVKVCVDYTPMVSRDGSSAKIGSDCEVTLQLISQPAQYTGKALVSITTPKLCRTPLTKLSC
jgi:hypothetical protein